MAGTNKALGQHWLKNRAILEEIAELARDGTERSAERSADDFSGKQGCCVEIGPGLGYLTSSLLKRFDKVIAVEFDEKLARNLPGSFPGKNLEVVAGDILKYDFGGVPVPYVVAGNIPYYITSPIIEKVLTAEPAPERAVLLMQKEVAERVVDERESVLSLMVKNRADVELGPVVVAAEFEPAPKVDSQVLVLVPHAPICGEEVFTLIRKGFSAPRKKLVHNIAGLCSKERLLEIFRELAIDENARPADLHLETWQKLYDRLYFS